MYYRYLRWAIGLKVFILNVRRLDDTYPANTDTILGSNVNSEKSTIRNTLYEGDDSRGDARDIAKIEKDSQKSNRNESLSNLWAACHPYRETLQETNPKAGP